MVHLLVRAIEGHLLWRRRGGVGVVVRTFFVTLRASTAIAVQICANLLSVGLSCVRALVKLPKARHVQGRSKKKF